MCVDVNSALSMHEVTKRKHKEGNVGAFTPFVDVKSSDVTMIVDVVRNEKGSLENVKDVTGGCGWVNVLVNLIEENLCRIGIVSVSYLLGKNLFAPGREISVKEGVSMDDA